MGHASEGNCRTNVALGGAVEDVTDDIGPEPRRLAREATEAPGLDLAGVDPIPIGGTWSSSDVHTTAGFESPHSATEVSATPHVARPAIERVGGTIEESRIRELVSTLDDSIPECKPPLVADQGDNDVLGDTTRIRIHGQDGTEVRSATASGTDTRLLVDVALCPSGNWRPATASITDRSEMASPVPLERDHSKHTRLRSAGQSRNSHVWRRRSVDGYRSDERPPKQTSAPSLLRVIRSPVSTRAGHADLRQSCP